ncbi:hypothetical protein AB0O18_31105 [Streptomyces sp. NPDC093224]|uniref:hypothetical protein n=1 Tax=Streptomyces sp. NPDC093224 TaxID=3155198 RepID=UPI00341C9933
MTATTLATGPHAAQVAALAFEPLALPGIPPRDRRACPYCQCNRNSDTMAPRPSLRYEG